jgi:hypothetical protein
MKIINVQMTLSRLELFYLGLYEKPAWLKEGRPGPVLQNAVAAAKAGF